MCIITTFSHSVDKTNKRDKSPDCVIRIQGLSRALGRHLLLFFLWDIAQVETLAGDVNEFEFVEFADVIDSWLVNGLCQVQHLRSGKYLRTSTFKCCALAILSAYKSRYSAPEGCILCIALQVQYLRSKTLCPRIAQALCAGKARQMPRPPCRIMQSSIKLVVHTSAKRGPASIDAT